MLLRSSFDCNRRKWWYFFILVVQEPSKTITWCLLKSTISTCLRILKSLDNIELTTIFLCCWGFFNLQILHNSRNIRATGFGVYYLSFRAYVILPQPQYFNDLYLKCKYIFLRCKYWINCSSWFFLFFLPNTLNFL